MYLCHIWCALPHDELFTKKTISRTISGTKQQTWVPLGTVKIRTHTCIPPTFNFAWSYWDWYHLILLDSSSGEQEPTEISCLEHSEKWARKQTCPQNSTNLESLYFWYSYFIVTSFVIVTYHQLVSWHISPSLQGTFPAFFSKPLEALKSRRPFAACWSSTSNLKVWSGKKSYLGTL